MAHYEVTFTDGSEPALLNAKVVKYAEHGVLFEGRKNAQGPHSLVAFVPYVNLRMVRELPPAR
ncbi:hypothetical protein ACFY1Q_11640 [Streptomyces albidoflavus]